VDPSVSMKRSTMHASDDEQERASRLLLRDEAVG
jgi:hypothetical protein